MHLYVVLGVFLVISGGRSSPFVSPNNAATKRYDDFGTTSAPKIVVGGSTWRNRFSPNFKPVNPRYSRPFIKPAINSEPAQMLPELPTNGVEPNPHPVVMTFLPVFPWPSNMPSKDVIYSMFPRSGANEFWPRPRVDDRMSHFPMPGQPLPGSNYNSVPSTQNQNQVPSTLAPVYQAPVTAKPWTRHVPSTVSTTASTTTTTTVPTTTTTTPPPTTTTVSEAESNHIWDSTELLKQPTFPEVVPSLAFSRDSEENSVERESEPVTSTPTTTTTTVATTTRRYYVPRRNVKRPAATLSTKYDFLNNRKTKNLCRPLNPLTDSVPHPDSDQSCDPDLSSWRKSPSCRCRYLVAARNVVGCPIRFHTICWRIKT